MTNGFKRFHRPWIIGPLALLHFMTTTGLLFLGIHFMGACFDQPCSEATEILWHAQNVGLQIFSFPVLLLPHRLLPGLWGWASFGINSLLWATVLFWAGRAWKMWRARAKAV
jgi:hypothetical protein